MEDRTLLYGLSPAEREVSVTQGFSLSSSSSSSSSSGEESTETQSLRFWRLLYQLSVLSNSRERDKTRTPLSLSLHGGALYKRGLCTFAQRVKDMTALGAELVLMTDTEIGQTEIFDTPLGKEKIDRETAGSLGAMTYGDGNYLQLVAAQREEMNEHRMTRCHYIEGDHGTERERETKREKRQDTATNHPTNYINGKKSNQNIESTAHRDHCLSFNFSLSISLSLYISLTNIMFTTKATITTATTQPKHRTLSTLSLLLSRGCLDREWIWQWCPLGKPDSIFSNNRGWIQYGEIKCPACFLSIFRMFILFIHIGRED